MSYSRAIRRSAKQVVTSLANELIKSAEVGGSPHSRDSLECQILACQRIAIRMGWDALDAHIDRWRKAQLNGGVTCER